jgi:hypothetical protein
MGEPLPKTSFSRVTYEETFAQAAPTEDMVNKLGANQQYLQDQVDSVLPSNDSAISALISAIEAKNPNAKFIHVGDFYGDAPTDHVPVWFVAYTPGESTWTATLCLCFPGGSGLTLMDGTRRTIESGIPLGEKRCFVFGRVNQVVRAWRVTIV